MRNRARGQAGFREVLRQIPEGEEAGPVAGAQGAAGQERTDRAARGWGPPRGASAEAPGPSPRPRPGPAAAVPFPSPARRNASTAEPGKQEVEADNVAAAPGLRPGTRPYVRCPASRRPRSGARGWPEGGGERVGWVCLVLSPPLTARPGGALGRRRPRPRLAAIPAPSPSATPPRSPQNPGPRAHANPANPSLEARRHRDAPQPRAPSRTEGGRGARDWDRAVHNTLPRGGYSGPALTSASPSGRWQHCAGPPRLPDRGTRLTSARRGRTVGCPRKWEGQRGGRGWNGPPRWAGLSSSSAPCLGRAGCVPILRFCTF